MARLLAPGRARLAGAVVAFVVKHSPLWLLPLCAANVVDVVVARGPLAELWANCGVLLVLLLLNVPGHQVYVRLMYRVVLDLGVALRSALARRFQVLSMGYHARTGSGVLHAKLVRDVENIEETVWQATDIGLSALTTLVGGFVVIAVKTPELLPVFAVTVPAVGLVVARLNGPMRRTNEEVRREYERLSAGVLEMLTLLPVARAHGLERHAVSRFDTGLGRLRRSAFGLGVLNGWFGALIWCIMHVLGLLCLAGSALLAYHGVFGLTAGDVVMLNAYFATLTAATTTLLAVTPVLTRGREAVRSLAEVLDEPDLEENTGKRAVTSVVGRLRLEDVTYRYDDVATPAVAGLTLDIPAGQTVALVGASGAGKSTVANLLIGFLRPSEGRVLLDGVDMADLDLRTYRRFLSVVPQETVLFDGSVRDNVAYGMPDVTDAALTAALADANALDFVRALPDGLDTVVGEHGAHLSGGQKQRLAIARALIRDPRVLILDEATSALDAHSESLVQEALARLVKGRTTIVVAHRLSTIRAADRIVVLADGAVAESGTHTALLTADGPYARLHARSQETSSA
ncbi:ABC transporter ATP-binding protein [Actinocorallia sp. A-T 12471]|uniref:ABC transporter ATP-binding protein n=1 Tax=Actinocorallia sp. A-T 12471 TaxID=3089813 RepID=UPI0029D13D4F|nr:ABC transporter ATP-binding protein [Actinocorallia sp. A-T 12471]MDX6740417.1 ABC transporter ATP-binding protein [Actinocorallia sp. A-T 12471]